MSEYNSIQNDYRDKCKDKIERQLRITGNEKSSDEIEDMLENGDPAVFTQGVSACTTGSGILCWTWSSSSPCTTDLRVNEAWLLAFQKEEVLL